MKVYRGFVDREKTQALVTVDGGSLPTYQHVKYYTSKFWFGYHGSGAAQLALAILCDLYGTESKEKNYHQQFKRLVIAKLPIGNWALQEEEVRKKVDEIMERGKDHEKANGGS